MLDGVLEGKLNAAFIDGPINHTAIDGIPVYREELMIVTPQGYAPVTRASQVNGSNIYAFRANLRNIFITIGFCIESRICLP